MRFRHIVAVAATVTLAVGGSAYAATAASGSTGPGWKAPTIVPGGSGASLSEVMPVSASDIWAVGADSNDHVMLLHYNGSAWKKVAMPTGETHLLRLVPGSGDNTWLMTYTKYLGDNEYTGQKLWQRVGGAWQQQDTYRDVYATVGSTVVWAAEPGYVERFDGTQWTKHSIPADVEVNFMHADGADDVWTVGQHYTGEGDSRAAGALYSLHWDGTGWTEPAMPDVESPDGQAGYLRDIGGTAADDRYAVGFWQNFNGEQTDLVMLHWDGQKWSTVDTPNFGRGGESIATSSHGGVWVTGIYAYNPTVLYRNPDNTWKKVQPSGKNPIFVNAVANIPGTDKAIAVGAVGVSTSSGLQPAIAYDK